MGLSWVWYIVRYFCTTIHSKILLTKFSVCFLLLFLGPAVACVRGMFYLYFFFIIEKPSCIYPDLFCVFLFSFFFFFVFIFFFFFSPSTPMQNSPPLFFFPALFLFFTMSDEQSLLLLHYYFIVRPLNILYFHVSPFFSFLPFLLPA